jgi:RNA polymerase sigma-54 factor
MAIKLSQGQKQIQTVSMTPQLQQAIKLLTLTHLEMTNIIAEEMVENPMLEEIEDSINIESHSDDFENGENSLESSEDGGVDKEFESEFDREAFGEDFNRENLETQLREGSESTPHDFTEKPLMKERDEFDWESYVDSYNTNSSTPNMAQGDSDEMNNYENMVSSTTSLADHLIWQLQMEHLSENELKISEEIIHNLNDDGHLDISLDAISASTGASFERINEVRERIMRLDPTGCGALDVKECLLAQARFAEERSPVLEKIILYHLEDLHMRNFDKISKKIGVPIDQIKETSLLLQNFYPNPGRLITNGETQYILPDIYVVEVGGEFVVQVNDDGIPRLKISKTYQDFIKRGISKKNDETSEFIKDKLRAAEWLIKSIQNRQRTIDKVAKAIVSRQQEFFKKGVKYLKPMILKDIALEIGMHESTVSRVTTNKYMHTPIGMFELKYFFTSSISGSNGADDVSSEVLKLKIKQIFDKENPSRPFSDQKVVDILAKDGVKIARRTVTKYREMLNIFPSSKRKI